MARLTADQAVRTGLVVFGGQMLGRLLDLGAILLIARHYSAAEFGRFSFVAAYAGYFAIVIDLGFNITFIRALVQTPERQRELLSGMLAVKLITTLLAMGLAAALILVPGYSADTVRLTWIILPVFILSFKFPSIRLVYEQLFQARLRMATPIALRLLDSLVFIALALLLIPAGAALPLVMAAYALSPLPGFLVLFRAARGMVAPAPGVDWRLMGRLLNQALPVALLGVFAVLSSRLDVLLLSLWQSETHIGYYAAAYRLPEALRMLSSAVVMAIYPLLAQYAVREPEEIRKVLTITQKFLGLLILPFCVGGSLLADRLITLFYTDRFLPAGDALEILIWAEPALLFSGLLSHALLALNRQRQVLVIAFLMLCANLTLNTMLIPSHSYIGASVARTITEGAGILGYGLVVYRLLRWSWWRSVLPLLPGAGGMFLWVWLMQSCSLWIVVPAAAAVYGLGLWITGGVTPGDLAGLSRMWTARQEKQPPFRYDHAT